MLQSSNRLFIASAVFSKRSFITFTLLFWLSTVTSTGFAAEKFVRVCSDGDAYPPFSWLITSADGRQEFTGLSIDVLQTIFRKRQWSHTMVILPFKRCLRDTANGEMADMIMNGSANAEREKSFYFSEPLWSVSIHAIYARREFPTGLPLAQRKDLLRFRLCGVQGHNFSMLGLVDEQLDLGADSYEAVFAKLSLGRCQIFPYNIEVIEGHRLIGKNYFASGEFGHQAIPEIPSWPVRMLIAKSFELAEQLRTDIDEELRLMHNSGELQQRFDQIMQQH